MPRLVAAMIAASLLNLNLVLSSFAFAETSFYSESYRDFFSDRTIQFQRLRHDGKLGSLFSRDLLLFGSASHEIYDRRSLFSLEVGTEYLFFKNWRAQAAARWLNLNQESNRDVQWRLGVLGGHYAELGTPWLVYEDYVEGFLLVPNRSKSQFAGSASSRLAYRGYSKNNWIVDYLTGELRAYRASNPAYAGRSYLAANLGPRVAYWGQQGSVSLFVARGLLWTRGEKARGDYWFLLTMGASF